MPFKSVNHSLPPKKKGSARGYFPQTEPNVDQSLREFHIADSNSDFEGLSLKILGNPVKEKRRTLRDSG
jgi:hypothetical protein